tara:strand:+ start:1156 stop:2394 length:1239 start_codon:yes stop_codon:yes gene_type:complete
MKTITKNEVKTLIITHYFWPENFKINDFANFLSKNNKITVLTGSPSYPKKNIFKDFKKKKLNYKNIEILRVPVFKRNNNRFSLFLNYLSFLISLSTIGVIKLINKKFDLILVFGTSPPTVMIPAIILSKLKKIKVAFWVLDLWPETLISMNIIKNKFLIKLIRIYVSYAYNFSDLIFAQSKAFVVKIGKYCDNKKKIIYFPTWADQLSKNRKNSKKFLFKKKLFYITFTGNIGEAQDFKNILQCAERLKFIKKIRWLIVGDGSKYNWLKNELKRKNLTDNFLLTGNLPSHQIPSILKNSDCLLLSLKKGGIDKFTVPGKLSNYMMSKKPILGMIEGEAYNIIKNSKSGLVCKSGDFRMLSKNIIKLISFSNAKRRKMGNNGFNYSNENFNRLQQLNKGLFYLKKLLSNNKIY